MGVRLDLYGDEEGTVVESASHVHEVLDAALREAASARLLR